MAANGAKQIPKQRSASSFAEDQNDENTDVGTRVLQSSQVDAPPPRFPKTKIPAFEWREGTDAFPVERIREIESFIRQSPYHLKRHTVTNRVPKYSDQDRLSQQQNYGEQKQGSMFDELMHIVHPLKESPLYTKEIFHQSSKRVARIARSYSNASNSSVKRQRSGQIDEDAKVPGESSGKEGDEKEEGGNNEENGSEAGEDEEEEEAVDEDFNDYAVNYYESDEEGGMGDEDDEPAM